MTIRDKDHIQSDAGDKRSLWPSQILRYFITVILSGLVVNWVSEPSRNILIKIYEGAQNLLLGFVNSSILNQTYKSIAGNSLINIGDLTSIFSSAATISIGAMFFLFVIQIFTSSNFLEKWSGSIFTIIISIVVISNIFLIQHRQNVILFFRQSSTVLTPFLHQQEILHIRSDFAEIRTPDDYAEILMKLIFLEKLVNECLQDSKVVRLPDIVLPANKSSSDISSLFLTPKFQDYSPRLAEDLVCKNDTRLSPLQPQNLPSVVPLQE